MHAARALIDAVLRAAWSEHARRAAGDLALVAVGGYGRGELHPCSDIDILVLLPQRPADGERATVERLVTFLWDIGLEVGHSVRTSTNAREESAADVSVMTTLLEARLLAGTPNAVRRHARGACARSHLAGAGVLRGQGPGAGRAPPKANDTAYNLEPNVKTGPGGLRDIQTIGWVAKRHFGTDSLDELVAHGFLTARSCAS